MNAFTHGLLPSCTTPNGAGDGFHERAEAGEQNDDAEAEDDRLQHAVALAARLAIQEIGNGERDHRENARREDRREPCAESGEQEEAEVRTIAGAGAGRERVRRGRDAARPVGTNV